MAARIPEHVAVTYLVPRVSEAWSLSEEPVPESRAHDLTIDLLKAILAAWAARTGRSMQVGRNLAVRWDEEHPSVGVDPDIYVVEPAPPEGDDVTSLRLWETGHAPPLLAVEIVSAGNPRKDYAAAPERYAASGMRELWVFDPELRGPALGGGPHRIQVWQRQDDAGFARVYAGDGPAWSRAVDAWLVTAEGGARLRIADEADGAALWPTAVEAERAAKEAERAAKEAALARVAELEAELGKRRG